MITSICYIAIVYLCACSVCPSFYLLQAKKRVHVHQSDHPGDISDIAGYRTLQIGIYVGDYNFRHNNMEAYYRGVPSYIYAHYRAGTLDSS